MSKQSTDHPTVLADVPHEARNGKPLLSSDWDWVEQTQRLIAHKAYGNGSG